MRVQMEKVKCPGVCRGPEALPKGLRTLENQFASPPLLTLSEGIALLSCGACMRETIKRIDR